MKLNTPAHCSASFCVRNSGNRSNTRGYFSRNVVTSKAYKKNSPPLIVVLFRIIIFRISNNRHRKYVRFAFVRRLKSTTILTKKHKCTMSFANTRALYTAKVSKMLAMPTFSRFHYFSLSPYFRTLPADCNSKDISETVSLTVK